MKLTAAFVAVALGASSIHALSINANDGHHVLARLGTTLDGSTVLQAAKRGTDSDLSLHGPGDDDEINECYLAQRGVSNLMQHASNLVDVKLDHAAINKLLEGLPDNEEDLAALARSEENMESNTFNHALYNIRGQPDPDFLQDLKAFRAHLETLPRKGLLLEKVSADRLVKERFEQLKRHPPPSNTEGVSFEEAWLQHAKNLQEAVENVERAARIARDAARPVTLRSKGPPKLPIRRPHFRGELHSQPRVSASTSAEQHRAVNDEMLERLKKLT